MSSDPAIRVENVSKSFSVFERPSHRLMELLWGSKKKYGREFWALRDVGFEVHPGECLGVLGANGSGKSTLLQIIAGTLSPTKGECAVNGSVAALLELGNGFNPEFTGRENVYMNGAILGLSDAEVRDRFDDIADFAAIGDFVEQPVKTYSSGMMLRLAFAVQVLVEPDVLLIDEALAVGDAKFQLKCMARLDEMRARGTTLMFVSHSIDQVKQLCTRGVVLHKGAMVAEGDPVECGLEYYKILFPTQSAGPVPAPPVAAPPAAAGADGTVPGQPEAPASGVPASGASASGSGDGAEPTRAAPGVDDPPTEDSRTGAEIEALARAPEGARLGETGIEGRLVVDLAGAHRYGRGGAELVEMYVEGVRTPNIFSGGEEIVLETVYRFDYDRIREIVEADEVEPLLQCGVRIDNSSGVTLTDLVSETQPWTPLRDLESRGSILRLRFRFRVPMLQSGEYFLSPGVAVGRPGGVSPLVEYVHLHPLRCISSGEVHGLMRWEYRVDASVESVQGV